MCSETHLAHQEWPNQVFHLSLYLMIQRQWRSKTDISIVYEEYADKITHHHYYEFNFKWRLQFNDSTSRWSCEFVKRSKYNFFFLCKLNNFFPNYSCHLQVYFAHFMLNQTAISIWRNFVLFSICFAYYHSSIFDISRETL